MTNVNALLDELRRTLPADSMSYTAKSAPWDVDGVMLPRMAGVVPACEAATG